MAAGKNYLDLTFCSNTYSFILFNRIQLQDPDEDDDEDRCSIVVSLMRIDRKRTPANERPPIGFAIYKVTMKLSLSESNCVLQNSFAPE